MTSIELFTTLFKGRENCHGVHLPETGDNKEGEKRKGKSFTKDTIATQQDYEQHLAGKTGLGIVPLCVDGNVHFAALDVDVYPLKPNLYIEIVKFNKLPLHLFRSKSGGMHAFIFFKEPVKASKLKPLLEELKVPLGLSTTTEVFPKQAKLEEGKMGNWINLPYFENNKTTRFLYSQDGDPLAFEDAMEYLYANRTTLAELQTAIEALPFSSGPPCLQTLYLTKQISASNHNRNMFLFNAGLYLKQRNPTDYMTRLGLVNKTLDVPLSDGELAATIRGSLQKGDYNYQCEDPLLNGFCNKGVCVKRKFGRNAGINTELMFERLVQVMADPPYYKWKVNGVYMHFDNETELRNQNKFQDYCIRHLHYCPATMKNQVWCNILNKALAKMETEQVSSDEQISASTMFFASLRSFLLERVKAKVPEQVLMGQPYYNTELAEYCFRSEDFVKAVFMDKTQKNLTLGEVRRELKRYGAEAKKLYLPTKKSSIRVWCIKEIYLQGETFAPTPTPGADAVVSSSSSDSSKASSADKLVQATGNLVSEPTIDDLESKPKKAKKTKDMDPSDIINDIYGDENTAPEVPWEDGEERF